MRRLRAIGGHKAHLVPDGSGVAMCGFKPSGAPRQQVARHGWAPASDYAPNCAACVCASAAAKEKANDVE